MYAHFSFMYDHREKLAHYQWFFFCPMCVCGYLCTNDLLSTCKEKVNTSTMNESHCSICPIPSDHIEIDYSVIVQKGFLSIHS